MLPFLNLDKREKIKVVTDMEGKKNKLIFHKPGIHQL